MCYPTTHQESHRATSSSFTSNGQPVSSFILLQHCPLCLHKSVHTFHYIFHPYIQVKILGRTRVLFPALSELKFFLLHTNHLPDPPSLLPLGTDTSSNGD